MMAVVYPDVVLISSDDEDDDGQTNFMTSVANPEIVLISSDDEDGERNLEEGVASEQEAEYIDLDDDESDNEEEDNNIVVEKLNMEISVDNCDRSGLFIQGGNNLHALSLPECKEYLRKHGIRVSGTKEECIQRIEEHNRLKDGKGESFYPKSSFSINCTGDACSGDVVLFKQNMYNSQRNLIGRRTVAGRIVKESYGASTKHTFLVEVLWSKRYQKLDPLSILPVTGRNLYQFGTFRQPWKSEAERSTVLEEKHERGKAARLKWKLREKDFVFGDNKGKKLHKVSHRVSSHSKHKFVNKNTTAHNQAVLFQNPDLKRSTQPTYHSDPNCSMSSDHHLQEASLPFSYDRNPQFNCLPTCSSSGHSHHNNEQQAPDQGLSQPPDHHHHDSEQGGPDQGLSQPPDHHHHNSESPVHRPKEEKAKFLFPESSFSINCTGDARERDVVLFKQQVFLRGKHVDKRTVAGRIVKVRQCGSRDKHKFLIKVLWTLPSMNNSRRLPWLVRSHNLYKFGTFRQPWKDETVRSKMSEEKHGPATRKRKLKKTDIAWNKNEGKKRQKVSHNGPSPSKQPTQTAKQKSSKGKDARATRVKETKKGSKRKSVKIQKKKAKKSKQQTIQPHPNPNTNLDPSLSTKLDQNPNSKLPSTTLNPNPSLHLNPNEHTNPNAHQNQNLNTHQNQNLNSTDPNLNTNLNPISSTTSHPSPSQHLNPKQHTNSNAHQNRILNTHQNQNANSNDSNLNLNSNPISSTTPNPSPGPHLNPNKHTNPGTKPRQNPGTKPRQNPNPKPPQNPNPKPRQNLNPKPRQNPNPNTHQNPNPNTHQNPHPNTRQNPNLNPNNYMPAHQLQGSSLSLPNQLPVWIPPNQAHFGFPGYGGQWGPNHILTQPPVYDYMAVLLLAALCYQQQ